MDKRITKNIMYIMIYSAGILTGLSIIWKYPKVYSVLLLILVIGFIINVNNMISKKNGNDKLIIKIR